MGSDSPSPARLLAAHLVVVVAVVHLSLGVLHWIRWARAGFLLPRDLRWPLFVLSGLALLAGLAAAANARRRRPLYVGGVALMVVYVVGYFVWHVGGHRSLVFLGPGTPHRGPLVPFLVDHLLAGPVVTLALCSEVALALLLCYLLVTESSAPTRRRGREGR